MNVISPGNLAYSAARCYQQTARPTTTSLLTANLCRLVTWCLLSPGSW